MKVRVAKIESYRDIDGKLGKQIVLVQDMEAVPKLAIRGDASQEVQAMFEGVMQGVQMMIPMPMGRNMMSSPKFYLFLTEEECDALGLTFDVNQEYDATLANGTIQFKKIVPA